MNVVEQFIENIKTFARREKKEFKTGAWLKSLNQTSLNQLLDMCGRFINDDQDDLTTLGLTVTVFQSKTKELALDQDKLEALLRELVVHIHLEDLQRKGAIEFHTFEDSSGEEMIALKTGKLFQPLTLGENGLIH